MNRKHAIIAGVIVLVFFFTLSADAQWVPVGFQDTSVTVLLASGSNLYAGGTNLYEGLFFEPQSHFYRSTDSGASWQDLGSIVNDTLASIYSLSAIDTIFFAGLSNYDSRTGYGLFRSTNEGLSWVPIPDSLFSKTNVSVVTAIGSSLLAGTEDSGILRSQDGGNTWAEASNGIPKIMIDPYNTKDTFSNSVNTIVTIGTNIFAGMNDCVYLSTDTGKNWVPLDDGMGDTIGWNYLTPFGSGFFSATAYGVFRSTNEGRTWATSSTGLPPIDPFVMAIDMSGTDIFVASSAIDPEGLGTIYLSTDSGASWHDASEGLGTGSINFGLFAVLGSYIFVSTEYGSNGIYRRPLSDFGNNAVVGPTPAITSDLSVCPNPFTSSTTLHIAVSESGVASIAVVNTLGTEVARVFDGELAAGEQELTWNPAGLPAGTYWCEVRMNDETSEIPVVLTR